jgi:outer membrane protein
MKRMALIFAIGTLVLSVGAAAAQTPPTQRPSTPTSTSQTPPQTPSGTPAPRPPATAPPATPAVPVPFPADAKIGFVNMQSIVAESKLGKQGQAQMKALHDKNAANLSAKAKAIQDLQQQIQAQQGTLSESVLQQKQRDLERLQREAQTEQQNAQADEQNLNDDLLTNFQEKVLPVIEALRTEKGLWVIFAVQTTDGGLAVASANQGLDLSLEVVKRLDAKTSGAPDGK